MTHWWQRAWTWVRPHATSQFTVVFATELPDDPESDRLYLIGERKPWLAALRCPCGCRNLIQLSLLEDDAPRWRLRMRRRKRPTLSPSILRTSGCKSHFFLRDGRIFWCSKDVDVIWD